MLTLRTGDIEAVILPDKGADIYSLTDRRTGVDHRRWMSEPGPFLDDLDAIYRRRGSVPAS